MIGKPLEIGTGVSCRAGGSGEGGCGEGAVRRAAAGRVAM